MRVLALGGLDPSGRAGILADAETIRQMGGQAYAIATALTAQGTATFSLDPVKPKIIRRQVDAVLELGKIDAVKLGVVPSRLHLREIVLALKSVKVPWIVDPVVFSSKQETLSTLSPEDFIALADPLRALTPNLDELHWIIGRSTRLPRRSPTRSESRGARILLQYGFGAVVVKGGHRQNQAADRLYQPDLFTQFDSKKLVRSADVRGTGCRFASAMAVRLGQNKSYQVAVRDAKAYVRKYIQGAR